MQVKLTQKQNEVLYYLSQAYSNQQIANEMGISVATVKLHLSIIYEKLNAHTRTKALIEAQAAGIVPKKPPKLRRNIANSKQYDDNTPAAQ